MKTNGHGRECPQWCATDHERPGHELDNCRTGERPVPARPGMEAWAFASLPPTADKPYVAVSASAGMVFARDPYEAKDIAGVVRGLADLTPAKIRQFAAQIDRASDAAFGSEAEAEAGA